MVPHMTLENSSYLLVRVTYVLTVPLNLCAIFELGNLLSIHIELDRVQPRLCLERRPTM
jgi:hypothetical protein